MPLSVPVLATASILTALAFLEAVAYFDDGTTLAGSSTRGSLHRLTADRRLISPFFDPLEGWRTTNHEHDRNYSQ